MQISQQKKLERGIYVGYGIIFFVFLSLFFIAFNIGLYIIELL